MPGCSPSTAAVEDAGRDGAASSSGSDYGNAQMAPTRPLLVWTHQLTLSLLQKIQQRKGLFLDPELRRGTVYAEVAREFQEEGVNFTPSDIEKKYTSLLSTYRHNIERKKGSTWQYFHILENIHSEVGPDGERVLLPTSSFNPLQHSPRYRAVGKQWQWRPIFLRDYCFSAWSNSCVGLGNGCCEVCLASCCAGCGAACSEVGMASCGEVGMASCGEVCIASCTSCCV